METTEEKVLALRAYYFVPYNISQMQMGIQAGHAGWRYARRFFESNPLTWEFVDNHETTIILDGGTTNSRRDFEGVAIGTLNQIGDALLENDIPFSYFEEIDLNDALTALCFIADERVFNKVDYPDLPDYLYGLSLKTETDLGKGMHQIASIPLIAFKIKKDEELQELYPTEYKEWVRLVGGVKNVFLRDLLKDKKLAR
jgi:hypothetical protein